MTIDLMLVGIILLFVYVVLDFFRNKTKRLLRRIVWYSFFVYLLVVIRLTIGSVYIPPMQDEWFTEGRMQLVPFYFLWDLSQLYLHGGSDWFFWNSAKLTFYNFLMLMPLGVYAVILLKVRKRKWAALLIFLTSLLIETSQLILSERGFIMPRTFNVDDLLLNTLGGVFIFVITERIEYYAGFMKKRNPRHVR